MATSALSYPHRVLIRFLAKLIRNSHGCPPDLQYVSLPWGLLSNSSLSFTQTSLYFFSCFHTVKNTVIYDLNTLILAKSKPQIHVPPAKNLPMATTLRYGSLDPDKREIRLLRMKVDDSMPDPSQGYEMEKISLPPFWSRELAPTYYAISYVTRGVHC